MSDIRNIHNIWDIYQEIEILDSSGSQGQVRLAKDTRLGRKVAIKSIHSHLLEDDIQRQRLLDEAIILSQLNHPSIVTLYDIILDENGIHLVMEYVDAKPLNRLIVEDSGPIVEIRAINIFLQILDAMDTIHKKKILHRDIKPSNIMINLDDKVKLLDFGISYSSDDTDLRNQDRLNIIGTPMYMSPEHVSESSISIQSDIYCLGVTLFQMLTGTPPYRGINKNQIYAKILRDNLNDMRVIYPHITKRINDIVQKSTSKDPKDRYDSCKGFARDLKDHKRDLINEVTIQDPEDLFKNIEVKVRDVDEAIIIINESGCVGTELSYSGKPGERVKIVVSKEGYIQFVKQLTINQDRKIEINLIKKRKSIF